MKILMLGWEHPPVHSGGLGVATQNLANALTHHGHHIYFALPSFVHQKLRSAKNNYEIVAHTGEEIIEKIVIPTTILSPYQTIENYEQEFHKSVFVPNECGKGTLYGNNLIQEIHRYAAEIERVAGKRDFQIVHGHDWMTFPAAERVKNRKSKPFIAHIHSTEMDRTGGNAQQAIYDIERRGMENADKIIAVSEHTKRVLKKHYGIADDKIVAIHNGVDDDIPHDFEWKPKSDRKTVLFLGRLTIQKGPDWFLEIAKKVLRVRDDVDFLIGGTGDMLSRLVEKTVAEKMTKNVHFLGFLKDSEREKAFARADCYVMPSVSEPFGLSAVEAASRGVPVILSKQSGAKEVLRNSLSADFWNQDKLANLLLAVLEYKPLQKTLSEKAKVELQPLTWHAQTQKIHDLYCTL